MDLIDVYVTIYFKPQLKVEKNAIYLRGFEIEVDRFEPLFDIAKTKITDFVSKKLQAAINDSLFDTARTSNVQKITILSFIPNATGIDISGAIIIGGPSELDEDDYEIPPELTRVIVTASE